MFMIFLNFEGDDSLKAFCVGHDLFCGQFQFKCDFRNNFVDLISLSFAAFSQMPQKDKKM